jgi:hypothetical protein
MDDNIHKERRNLAGMTKNAPPVKKRLDKGVLLYYLA